MIPKLNPVSLRAAILAPRYTAHARFATSALRKSHITNTTGPDPPYGKVGVAKALDTPPNATPTPTLFQKEFSLADRVALVTGGNRGIGLEMALALAEAGARAVYCIDLPEEPGEEWSHSKHYAARMQGTGGEGRLEYISADVTDQDGMWKIGKAIGDKEGRLDICVANAGILKGDTPSLNYAAKDFQEVLSTNLNGVLYTAQAAGQQMERFGTGGSIILTASIAGSGAIQGHPWVSYCSSKAAIIQVARSMACELASKNIRVNTISPGFIKTNMTGQLLVDKPEVVENWMRQNPMGRIGRPDELRGAVAWLASDASSFCTGSDIVVSGGHHAW